VRLSFQELGTVLSSLQDREEVRGRECRVPNFARVVVPGAENQAIAPNGTATMMV